MWFKILLYSEIDLIHAFQFFNWRKKHNEIYSEIFNCLIKCQSAMKGHSFHFSNLLSLFRTVYLIIYYTYTAATVKTNWISDKNRKLSKNAQVCEFYGYLGCIFAFLESLRTLGLHYLIGR